MRGRSRRQRQRPTDPALTSKAVAPLSKADAPAPEHADAPAGKPPEVNVLHGMREAIRRNGATDEARDFPTPAAVDAGRQHRLAGKALDSAGWGRQDQAKRGTLRPDRGDIGDVLHRNVGDPAEPTQIGLPILAGDLVQPRPGRDAVFRLIPGA